MAIASLTKFTVPLGGGQTSASQGLLMPKLKYRFRITFLNFGVSGSSTELSKQVMTFKRPTVSFEEGVIDIYNSKLKYAGKYRWEDVSVMLRDDASGQVSRLVGEQVQKQFDFMEQASARSATDYKFQMNCEILDGGNGAFDPSTLEQWEIYGCFLKNIDYGDLSYAEATAPVTVNLTIGFDNAVQTDTSTGIGTNQMGVGANIGRTLGAVLIG
jgi:hypothetical protein